MKTRVRIKENSGLAKLGAKFLRVQNVALTVGNTIYLHNATKEQLLNNTTWLCHELVHVQQYKKLGIPKFLLLYFIEWIRKGYRNNKFEIEARTKETDTSILDKFCVE